MVLTPKQWWHHCAHTEHNKSELSHTDTADEDCPVCDLTLSAFTRPSSFSFRLFKSLPFVHGQTACIVLSSSKPAFHQLRAPPSLQMF
jgi:hypothetical protein